MSDVNVLLKRLDEQKARQARAQGTMDSIKEQWRNELGVDTPEEVQAIKDQTDKELSQLQGDLQAKLDEAEALLIQAESK